MKKITLDSIEVSSFIIPNHNQQIRKKDVVPSIRNEATDTNDDCWTQADAPPCIAPRTDDDDPLCTEAIAYPVDCDPNYFDTMPIVGGVECAKTIVEFTCPPKIDDPNPTGETGGINGCQSDCEMECSMAPVNCSDVCYV